MAPLRPEVATAVARDGACRVAALLTAVALVIAAGVTGALTASPADAATRVEDIFTAKLNHARSSRDIPRLAPRAALADVARKQARRMARRNTLYHNPNLTSDVHSWRWVGENVGYGPDPETVHVAFMNSTGHRANILDRDYTQVGIGAVVRNGRVWVSEVFRRPLRSTTSSHTVTGATFSHAVVFGSTGSTVRRVQARLQPQRAGHAGRVGS